MELLLSITGAFPDALWDQFQSSIQVQYTCIEPQAVFQHFTLTEKEILMR